MSNTTERATMTEEWSWTDSYSTRDGEPTMTLEAEGRQILSCDGNANCPNNADALLIRYAPGLLAACARVLARVDANGGSVRSITGAEVAAIRAALAKATGVRDAEAGP